MMTWFDGLTPAEQAKVRFCVERLEKGNAHRGTERIEDVNIYVLVARMFHFLNTLDNDRRLAYSMSVDPAWFDEYYRAAREMCPVAPRNAPYEYPKFVLEG